MTTTTMQAAFLTDIVAHPDDMAPRLIYADWVEAWADRFFERNASLSYYPLKQWLGPLIEPSVVVPRDEGRTLWRFEASGDGTKTWFHMNGSRWCFDWHNGFVEEIHAPLWAWLELAEVWTTQTPLRTFRPYFEDRPAYTNAVGRRVGQVQWLAFTSSFWQCPHVGKLDTLDLTGMPPPPRTMSSADSGYRPWRGLRRLLLRSLPYLSDMSQTRRLEQWQRILPDVTIEFVEG